MIQIEEQSSNSNISRSSLTPHGKDEYLQAIQVLGPRFKLFGTFLPDNENAAESAICILRDIVLEGAIVTHVITCQGRDHLVKVQLGRQLFYDYARRDSSALGVIRTLSRNEFFFFKKKNLPMAEARDFHCYSHVFENLEKRTIPSDHAAVCFVIQKTTTRGHNTRANVFPAGCPNIPFSAPFLQRPQVLSRSFLCARRIQTSP